MPHGLQHVLSLVDSKQRFDDSMKANKQKESDVSGAESKGGRGCVCVYVVNLCSEHKVMVAILNLFAEKGQC